MPKIIVQADQSAGAPAPVTLGERLVAPDLQSEPAAAAAGPDRCRAHLAARQRRAVRRSELPRGTGGDPGRHRPLASRQHATDIPILAGGIEHELAQLLERATPTAPAGTPSAKPHASSNAIAATSSNVAASPAPTRPETRQAGVRSAAHGRAFGARRSSRPPRRTAGRRTRTASPSRNPEYRRPTAPGRSTTGTTGTSSSRFGPSDPRYDYLSRSYDLSSARRIGARS